MRSLQEGRIGEVMTYRFKLNEPIGQGVRRIGLEQIDLAAAKLGVRVNIGAGIHDARRSLKRVRALLRLVRPALGEDLYKSESERLAGVGRLLSGARDADVMRETLAKLEARFGTLADGTGPTLEKVLRGSSSERAGSGVERAEALVQLKQARKLFTGRALRGVTIDHVVEGAGRTYRKARRSFHKAYRKPEDDAFHAWRKAAQSHWRHMLLLSRAWPEAISARAGEAKQLSQLLGEDHDYAVLKRFAATCSETALKAENVAALEALCGKCQSALREQARPRGERLFVESVEDLQQRLSLYWTSAQALAACPVLEPAVVQSAKAPGGRKKLRQRAR